MTVRSLQNIIFNRKGWLLWGCLFYFCGLPMVLSQTVISDKARIDELGTIRGRVLSYDSDGKFIFLKNSGDTVSVDSRRVQHSTVTRQIKLAQKGTVWHSMEAGLDWGKANSFDAVTPRGYLESNHAFVVNRFVQPGLGVGYQFQDDFRFMPVFASLTGELLERRVTPVYFTNLGYGFGWARKSTWIEYEEVRGGVHWHLGGGIKIAGRRNALYLKSGYKVQKMYSERETFGWWGGTGGFEHISRTIRRVYFGFSFAF